MLSINNSNYSPSFGDLNVARNPQTQAALMKCTVETLESIEKAKEILSETNFLNGILKKIGNKLVLRVEAPKGFEFPGAEGKRTVIEEKRYTNRIYSGPYSQPYSYGHGSAIEKDGDTVIFQKLSTKNCLSGCRTDWENVLRLGKLKNDENITEYRILPQNGSLSGDCRNNKKNEEFIYSDTNGDINCVGTYNYILNWAKELKAFDNKIKDIADGKIKLEGETYYPILTEAQKAEKEAAKRAAEEVKAKALEQQKLAVLNRILVQKS